MLWITYGYGHNTLAKRSAGVATALGIMEWVYLSVKPEWLGTMDDREYDGGSWFLMLLLLQPVLLFSAYSSLLPFFISAVSKSSHNTLSLFQCLPTADIPLFGLFISECGGGSKKVGIFAVLRKCGSKGENEDQDCVWENRKITHHIHKVLYIPFHCAKILQALCAWVRCSTVQILLLW